MQDAYGYKTKDLKIFHDKTSGLTWCVRVCEPTGARYNPLVEFYDCRYEHTNYGQFVSRYFLETMLEHEPKVGLNLNGGIPDWKISGVTMNRIIKWLKEVKNAD